MLRVLAFLLLSLAVHLAVGQLLREAHRDAPTQVIAAPQVLRPSVLQLISAPAKSPAVAAEPTPPARQEIKQAIATARPAKPAPTENPPAAAQAAAVPAPQQAPQIAPPAMAQASAPARQSRPAPSAAVAEVLSLQPSFRQPPQQPRYPSQARRRNQQGTVLLEVRLDERGAQRSLSVLRSSGVASLDRAAVEAVARWRFNPETSNGRAVPSRVQIPIQFALTASR